jgi:hypothetical protein
MLQIIQNDTYYCSFLKINQVPGLHVCQEFFGNIGFWLGGHGWYYLYKN